MTQTVGVIEYVVRADIEHLLVGNKRINAALDEMEARFNKADATVNKVSGSFTRMKQVSASVSTALAMPQVEELTKRLAQLSGKIGVSSDSLKNTTTQTQRYGSALSTTGQLLGTSYIGAVGRSTAELLKQAAAAIKSADANLEVRQSVLAEVEALQSASLALVEKVSAEKAAAAASLKAAEDALLAEELKADSIQETIHKLLAQQEAELLAAKASGDSAKASVMQAHVNVTKLRISAQETAINEKLTAAENKVTAAKKAEAAAAAQLAEVTAMEVTAKATLAQANEAVAIAQGKATLAAKTHTAVMSGVRSVYALLGGPTGLLLLAAAGVYSLYQSMNNTANIKQYKEEIDSLKDKIEGLTQAQAKASADKAADIIRDNERNIEKYKKQLEELRRKISAINQNPIITMVDDDGVEWVVDLTQTKLPRLQRQVNETQAKLDELTQSISRYGKVKDDLVAQAQNGDILTPEQVRLTKAASEAFLDAEANLKTFNIEQEKGAREAHRYSAELEAERLNIKENSEVYKRFISERMQAYDNNKQIEYSKQTQGISNEILILTEQMNKGAKAAAMLRAELSLGASANSEDIKRVRNEAEKLYETQQKVSRQQSFESSLKSKIKELKDELALLNSGLKENSKEMFVNQALQSAGVNSTSKLGGEVRRLAEEVYEATQKQKDLNDAISQNPYKAAEKSRSDALALIKRQIDSEVITFEEGEQKKLEVAAQYAKAIADARSNAAIIPQQELAGTVDPVQAYENELNQKLALFEAFVEEQIITQQRADELINAVKTEYEQNRLAAQEELFRKQSELHDLSMNMIDAFGEGATNAIVGLMSGMNNLKDAARGFAATILQQAVGALVQMGIQQVKNAMLQDTLDAKEKAKNAAKGVAYAGAISAQVATTSALAGQNAFAATAAIPIVGPGLAPAAASAAIMAAGALGAPAISTASLAGARRYGGTTSPNNLYRINESGQPEVLTMGAKDYLMMGNKGGNVTPVEKFNGGNSRPNITVVIENTGSPAQVVSQSYDQDGRTLRLVLAEISNQVRNHSGEFYSALTNSTNVTGKTQ